MTYNKVSGYVELRMQHNSADYVCTQQDVEVIEYMKGKSKKHLLVKIDDCWGERDDMDCLFVGNEEVNGAVSILTVASAITNVHRKYLPFF